MRPFTAPCVAIGLAFSLTSFASATVLTFDFGGQNGDTVPPGYGNRVSSLVSGQFTYGAAGGFTPNITVMYGAGLQLGGANPTREFGDLNNVLYRSINGSLDAGILEIDLDADPGYLACLDSFDLAAVFNPVTGTGEDLPARSIKVLNAQNNPLYDLEYDPNNPPSTYIPGTLPLRHRTFDFSGAPLTSSRIMIRIDLTQLEDIGGLSKVDRIAIDNIVFTQLAVPSPGVTTLLGGGLGLLAARRRRR